MKQISTIFLSLLVGIATTLTACKGDDEPKADKQVTLDKTAITVSPGTTEILKASVSPSGAAETALEWKSSSTNIATIENGIVTGVTGGTAIITVTIVENGNKANCTVTVNKSTKNEGTIINWK